MSILTFNIIHEVIRAVLPAATDAATKIVTTPRSNFYVVIAFTNRKSDRTFKDCVVYNESWGHTEDKPHYAKIAMGKARLSWQYEKDTNLILAESPNLCEVGDPKYQGGIFYRGIAVGVSGLESSLDEMVGMWIATALVAKAQLIRKAAESSSEHYFRVVG